MAIPKKGSRLITVDGIQYRWYVRHKPSYWQEFFEVKYGFAVEQVTSAKTSTLVVHTPYSRPDCLYDRNAAVIRPSDVAEAIQSAIKAGWDPLKSKGTVEYKFNVGTPLAQIKAEIRG